MRGAGACGASAHAGLGASAGCSRAACSRRARTLAAWCLNAHRERDRQFGRAMQYKGQVVVYIGRRDGLRGGARLRGRKLVFLGCSSGLGSAEGIATQMACAPSTAGQAAVIWPPLASLMTTQRMRSASRSAQRPPPPRRRVRSTTPTPGNTSTLSVKQGERGLVEQSVQGLQAAATRLQAACMWGGSGVRWRCLLRTHLGPSGLRRAAGQPAARSRRAPGARAAPGEGRGGGGVGC